MTTPSLALWASRPAAFGTLSDAPALPLLHPLVRAARRATELAAIEARLRDHGVTRCPTRFAAPSQHAVVVPVEDPGPPDDPPLAIATLREAARWLSDHGHPGFTVVRPGLYQRLGRLFTAEALLRSVRRLQARALRAAEAPPARRDPSRMRLSRAAADAAAGLAVR